VCASVCHVAADVGREVAARSWWQTEIKMIADCFAVAAGKSSHSLTVGKTVHDDDSWCFGGLNEAVLIVRFLSY